MMELAEAVELIKDPGGNDPDSSLEAAITVLTTGNYFHNLGTSREGVAPQLDLIAKVLAAICIKLKYGP